jgi:hypothetical protein
MTPARPYLMWPAAVLLHVDGEGEPMARRRPRTVLPVMRARRGKSQRPTDGPAYTVIASHWDSGWDVFILDASDGLVGQTRAPSRTKIEGAARAYLADARPSALPVTIDIIVR